MGVGLTAPPKVARVPPAREGGVSRPAVVVPVGPVEVWTQTLCGQELTPRAPRQAT